jgi:hypothetical protein
MAEHIVRRATDRWQHNLGPRHDRQTEQAHKAFFAYDRTYRKPNNGIVN